MSVPDPLIGEGGQLLPLNANTTALANALVVKSGQGVCYGFSGFSNKGAAQFILVFDLNAIPADGAVPVNVLTVPASSNFSVDYGFHGRVFRVGIVICNSSTAATKTIGSADTWIDAQYV